MAHMINSTQSLNGRRNGAARRAIKARAEEVVSDFDDLRKDVSKLASAVGQAARIEAVVAKDQVGALRRTLSDHAKSGGKRLHEQVRAHPGAALGASLGLGLIVGMALTARR